MNDEHIFKQVMDAINKKGCVSMSDIWALRELGVNVIPIINTTPNLQTLISYIYTQWDNKQ